MKPTVRIMLYLPPDLAEWLTEEAKAYGQARNKHIILILEERRLTVQATGQARTCPTS